MKSLFNKLGLAITFSPTGKALLAEAKRLTELFNARLMLIHVGEKNETTERLLSESISNSGLDESTIEIIRTNGDPADTIIKTSRDAGVDLLIAGALEKENFIKYYIGSVARKIMREAASSVLILKSPSETPKSFKRFYVSTDYSSESEKTILTAYNFALLEKADDFVLVKDFHVPGLASTIQGSGSLDELEAAREQWEAEEEIKMSLLVSELNLRGIKVDIRCLYGKEGWEAGNYARVHNADIFAVTPPSKKLKFLDKLFPQNMEHVIKELPANLLIVR